MRWLIGVVALVGCQGEGGPAPACEGEFEVYEPGMRFRTTQGNFWIEIREADPAPPDVGVNDWVVHLSSQSGTGVNGGTVSLTPWMEAHGHGLNPANYRGATTGSDGEYALDPFDLIMPGIWDFRFLVTEAMMNDTASVSLCIEG